VAQETIDELLAMELGNHVLDAFNIPFVNFIDNVVFATVIDLVGKYQLEMQKVFSYAPMARSMGPMLSEEGFHIGSGRGFLRDLAVAAHAGSGRYSIDEIQQVLNVWIPRGVEMFGNERGGDTAIAFGFKDRNNVTAQGEYYNEVREVLELVNIAVVQAKVKDTPAPEARTIVREVQDTRETISGVSSKDLLFAPDVKFFRSRGMEEIAFMPYDVNGDMMARYDTQNPQALRRLVAAGAQLKPYPREVLAGEALPATTLSATPFSATSLPATPLSFFRTYRPLSIPRRSHPGP